MSGLAIDVAAISGVAIAATYAADEHDRRLAEFRERIDPATVKALVLAVEAALAALSSQSWNGFGACSPWECAWCAGDWREEDGHDETCEFVVLRSALAPFRGKP